MMRWRADLQRAEGNLSRGSLITARRASTDRVWASFGKGG